MEKTTRLGGTHLCRDEEDDRIVRYPSVQRWRRRPDCEVPVCAEMGEEHRIARHPSAQLWKIGMQTRWVSLFQLRMMIIMFWAKLLLLLLSSSSAQAQQQLNHSQAAALLQLRSDLGIRSRYWPRGADPCSSWTGIQCQHGQVVSLHLSGLRRTAKRALLPSFSLDSLQAFPNLLSLNASGFPLPGRLPDWLHRLGNLQLVDFSSTSLYSSIPFSLGNLSNLQVFILARNNISGAIPSSFVELSRLSVLDLSSNIITGHIPADVTKLRNLQILNLSANYLEGNIPAGLGRLPLLRELDLASNQLNGSIPPQLGNLSHLFMLNLGSNALSGMIPTELGNLTSLNTLILSYNSLSGRIPIEITLCAALQVLSLNHNSLTGELSSLFGSLQRLSILNLSFNNLTGDLPVEILNLSQIKSINLSHNSFYGSLPTKVTELFKVIDLDFSYNFLTGNLSVSPLDGAILRSNCFSEAKNQRPFYICWGFYSSMGLAFHRVVPFTPSTNWHRQADDTVGERESLGALLGGVFGGLLLVLAVILLVLVVKKQERRQKSGGRRSITPAKTGPHCVIGMTPFCVGETFSYVQLKQATAEFNASQLLKAGHSGKFYKGSLEGGTPIVVKRIDLNDTKKDSFLTELDLFGKASHTRLVPLLGHCLELEDEKFLVYKYMPHGDLAQALHRKATASPSEDTLQSLDWITRLKIAIGAADGLMYLHHECSPPIVHRDVQASSIFLDDMFEVRLGSLSEASVAGAEAPNGVMARLFRMSQMSDQADPGAPVPTCAYDVYCFGKVLLELVTGKVGMSSPNNFSADAWLEWALPLINVYDRESMGKLVDPSLILDEDLLEEVWAMAIVAKSCLNPKPSKRPLVRYILKALENPLKVVRDDALNGLVRSRTSSHSSWNAAFFGSWRHSLSEAAILPGSLREEHLNKSSTKHPGNAGSQGSVHSEVSRRRPGSSEIFPEPVDDSVPQEPSSNR